jgi:hypothetical protein
MTAYLEHLGPRKFLAWCEPCGDGIASGTRKAAQAWADVHNQKHPEGQTPPAQEDPGEP